MIHASARTDNFQKKCGTAAQLKKLEQLLSMFPKK
jgi:hypothetical protein